MKAPNNYSYLEIYKNHIKIYVDTFSNLKPIEFKGCYYKDWENEYGKMSFCSWKKRSKECQIIELETNKSKKFILKRKIVDQNIFKLDSDFN